MRAEFRLAEMGRPAAAAVSALLRQTGASQACENPRHLDAKPAHRSAESAASRRTGRQRTQRHIVVLCRRIAARTAARAGQFVRLQSDERLDCALLHDADADVRDQAARAVGLRRIHAAVPPLIVALHDPDGAVRSHAAIALGRIGDPAAAKALFDMLADRDQFVRFAAMQALRTMNDWRLAPEYVKSNDPAMHFAMVLALTDVYEVGAVRALAEAAANTAAPETEAQAIEALGEVCRDADHYTGGWWYTQPARGKPARPKIHEWSGTGDVLAALHKALRDKQPAVRRAAVAALEDCGDATAEADLKRLLAADADNGVRRAVVALFAAEKTAAAVADLATIAANPARSDPLRTEAVRAIAAIGSPAAFDQLVALVADNKSSPDLITVGLETLGQLKNRGAFPAIEKRLASHEPQVRAAAVAALGSVSGQGAVPQLVRVLNDRDPSVRIAALQALSLLKAPSAVPAMVAAAANADVRFEAMQALAAMPDRQALAIYLQGVVEKNQSLREASLKALIALRSEIVPDIIELHKRNELSPAVRAELQTVFSSPEPIMRWQVVGAWTKPARPKFDPSKAPDLNHTFLIDGKPVGWRELTTRDDRGKFEGEQIHSNTANTWALAYAGINSEAGGPAQLLLGCDDQAVLWVNGRKVFEFLENRSWQPDATKLAVVLKPGVNHIYFLTGNTGGPWEWSLAVSRHEPKFAFLYENVPAKLDTAVYWDYGMKHNGAATHGRQLFNDLKGVSCVKCHSIAGVGGKVGPDLQGIGAKYPREELIRSVLEPSARVAEGYQVTIVATDSGRVYHGIVKSDTQEALELIDADGKTIRIRANEIEQRTKSGISLMPNGLKDGMTLDDFADIIAYLQSLRDLSATPKK